MTMVRTGDDLGLAGRVCVVTGGGSGIGQGIAVALAGAGCKVAILDRNEAGARETLDLVSKAGAEGVALTCDVSNQRSVEQACNSVRDRFGDAQVLVNNAAIARPGPLLDLPLSDWNELLSVNLTGYFLCAQVFGRVMVEKGEGSLVHISSVAADVAAPSSGAYCVAKAGITMLSQQLAVEWGPIGVRSNAVHPGLIYTPLNKELYARPGVMERRAAAIPARRVGQPDDVAEAVLFLASPRAAYVNGAVLAVDGGFSRNLMNFVPKAGDKQPGS